VKFLKKKALILAYDYPPYISVGGMRPNNWFNYLHEFEVEPIIITRQWANKFGSELDYIGASESNTTIIEKDERGVIMRTPYKPNLGNRLLLKHGEGKFRMIRKVITAFYEFAQFILPVGTKIGLYKEAKRFLEHNSVDLIIATGDPFILFKYANDLSDRYSTPWVADYRDLWSQDISINKKHLYKRWCRIFEKRIVRKASFVITVSEYLKHQITTLTEQRHVEIIPNGYNKELVDKWSHIEQGDKIFSIGFVGTIYKWNPIEQFLYAANRFVELNGAESLVVNFYGINIVEDVNSIIAIKFPLLTTVIKIHPRMENSLLIEQLLSNNLTLLFNHYTLMGTKIYEYLGINRPILFCFSDDEETKQLKQKHYVLKEVNGMSNSLQEDLIRDKNAGFIVRNSGHLVEIIESCYSEFKEKGYVSSNTKNSDEFSRRNQVKKLAELILSKK